MMDGLELTTSSIGIVVGYGDLKLVKILYTLVFVSNNRTDARILACPSSHEQEL